MQVSKQFVDVKWRIRDAVFALGVTIAGPLGIILSLFVLRRLGFLPEWLINILADDLYGMILFVAISLVFEIAMLVWLVKKYKLSFHDIGLRKAHIGKSIFLILAFYVLSLIIAAVLSVLAQVFVPGFNAEQAQEVGFEFGRGGIGLAASFILTVLIVPTVEELYFRGLLLPVFVRRWGAFVGISVTSAGFALLHLQANVGIFTFVLGVFLAILYIKSDSLWPSIFLHSLNNLIAFVILAGILS